MFLPSFLSWSPLSFLRQVDAHSALCGFSFGSTTAASAFALIWTALFEPMNALAASTGCAGIGFCSCTACIGHVLLLILLLALSGCSDDACIQGGPAQTFSCTAEGSKRETLGYVHAVGEWCAPHCQHLPAFGRLGGVLAAVIASPPLVLGGAMAHGVGTCAFCPCALCTASCLLLFLVCMYLGSDV